jgi:hypothetical protein
LAVVVLLATAGTLWLLQDREAAQVEEDPPATAAPAEGDAPAAPAEKDDAGDGAATDARVRVASPRPNAVVSSPLTVRGQARGSWYFEADFPVRLLDGDGEELAVSPARARDEWMTDDFVPFGVTLTFPEPATRTGLLTLDRANPSGLAENAAQVVLPVRFDASAPRTTALRPFFNNTAFGDEACDAVWPVPRGVEADGTDGSDGRAALAELLEGPTRAERERGYLTNIPEGTRIRSFRVEDGTAHADFDSTLARAAGSCRVLAIRAQIERTLLELPTVEDVVLSVEGEVAEALQP